MSKTDTLALIIAKPGPLRSSLLAILTTVPQIEFVAEINGAASLARLGQQVQPDLVLLEADESGQETLSALRKIQQRWPRTLSIVLVEDASQEQEAKAAGTDVVLVKGFPAAKLAATIETLLLQNDSSEE